MVFLINDNIRYLVKFIPEEKFIDSLIMEGELFLRPLSYYAHLEKEQSDCIRGDITEGLLLYCARICSPIYCTYAVFDKEVLPKGIIINKRAPQSFFGEKKGYFAVINYNDFISQLNADCFDGYSCTCGLVLYGSLSWEKQKHLFVTEPWQAAFVKPSKFSYQQEFRLLVHRNIEMIKDEKTTEEYKKVHGEYFPHPFYTYGHYIPKIGSLQHCAKKYCTEDFADYDDKHFILKT